MIRLNEFISVIILNILIAGCSTNPNVLTSSPPLIERSGFSKENAITKSEFLKNQASDIRNEIVKYEKTGVASVIETNQIIKIPFGQSTPIINCTPLRTCDIKLEKGEVVTGVYPGDTSRWLFEQAASGEGVQQQAHIIFKPKDYDIVTNAIITTTIRTYNVELHSQKEVTVKQIEFYYPQDFEERWNAIQKESTIENQSKERLLSEKKRLTDRTLDFSYRIETPLFSPKPVWTPYRVFNDGVHVYIQMPQQASTTSLPAFFILGRDNQPKLTNYRIQKPYYIVDELFKQAELKSGAGQDQQSVTITYNSRGLYDN